MNFPAFAATPPQNPSFYPSMALRLTCGSFLRHRVRLPLPPTRSWRPRTGLSDRHFVTFPSRPLLAAAASGREDLVVRQDDGQGGNGSLPVNAGGSGGKDGRIVPSELHKEATEAYMAYAMSVLLGRALPDVRDGLKPVHRRILFAMHDLGLSSRRPFKKCARVVGEVLGKFHPHGDTAVYDSLVRMAQDFSLRSPLIRGHGNFGSIDADPPAAMRYTECRLEALAEAMLLADLDQDCVDFVPNFDNSQKEPSLLPARLPTLLLNGSSGIAVGMATNIPPHNLGELVDALSALIYNSEATLQELLEYMPGPDFPTGGIIMGNSGILEAYRTGRGRIIIRGKIDIELLDSKSKRNAIIIKEIPYQTNKASLVEKVAELVENKSIEGIIDIRDESDRAGMRIVIELKRGSDPSIVLNNLYRLTALQTSFSCNMVGILNGQPQLMGLKELLQKLFSGEIGPLAQNEGMKGVLRRGCEDSCKLPPLGRWPIWLLKLVLSRDDCCSALPSFAFLDFRCSVVERRTRFKLAQAQNRKHTVEGIIKGLDNLDEVISIIRKASTNALASADLRNEYNLSEKQAEALLGISLGKLTVLEKKKYVDEDKSLMEQICNLQELLSSRKQILQLIEQEAIELKSKFSTSRRSVLEETESGQLEDIDVIPNEEMLLAFSEKGYVKRMKPNTFHLQNRGTIGKSVGKLRVNDTMSDFLVCHAHDHILYFSDKGIVYSARAYKIPECTRTAAGTPLIQILSLSDGERITSIIPLSDFAGEQCLLMLTINGFIKKASLSLFSSIRSTGILAIQLVPGDELKWVRLCANDDLVAMASQDGMVILSSCETIRALKRNTRGCVAMRLKVGDKMASMDIIPAALRKDLEKLAEAHQSQGRSSGPWLLFVSESGFGKRVPLRKFRLSPLNRIGLRGYKFSHEDGLAAVFVVGFSLADGESDEQVLLVSQSGTVNRIKVRDVSIQSRHARGVILMRLDHAGKIQSASMISATEMETDEALDPHENSTAVQ